MSATSNNVHGFLSTTSTATAKQHPAIVLTFNPTWIGNEPIRFRVMLTKGNNFTKQTDFAVEFYMRVLSEAPKNLKERGEKGEIVAIKHELLWDKKGQFSEKYKSSFILDPKFTAIKNEQLKLSSFELRVDPQTERMDNILLWDHSFLPEGNVDCFEVVRGHQYQMILRFDPGSNIIERIRAKESLKIGLFDPKTREPIISYNKDNVPSDFYDNYSIVWEMNPETLPLLVKPKEKKERVEPLMTGVTSASSVGTASTATSVSSASSVTSMGSANSTISVIPAFMLPPSTAALMTPKVNTFNNNDTNTPYDWHKLVAAVANAPNAKVMTLPSLDPDKFNPEFPLPANGVYTNFSSPNQSLLTKVLLEVEKSAVIFSQAFEQVATFNSKKDSDQPKINFTPQQRMGRVYLEMVHYITRINLVQKVNHFIKNPDDFFQWEEAISQGITSEMAVRADRKPEESKEALDRLQVSGNKVLKRFVQRISWALALPNRPVNFDKNIGEFLLTVIFMDEDLAKSWVEFSKENDKVSKPILANLEDYEVAFLPAESGGRGLKIQWPHSPEMLEELIKAGFEHAPTITHPDNCFHRASKKTISGWLPWRSPQSITNLLLELFGDTNSKNNSLAPVATRTAVATGTPITTKTSVAASASVTTNASAAASASVATSSAAAATSTPITSSSSASSNAASAATSSVHILPSIIAVTNSFANTPTPAGEISMFGGHLPPPPPVTWSAPTVATMPSITSGTLATSGTMATLTAPASNTAAATGATASATASATATATVTSTVVKPTTNSL